MTKKVYWHPVSIEREGKSYKGRYSGDGKSVTVTYGGYTMATELGSMRAAVLACQLLSELVAKYKNK